jgi:hypothetical protein
MATSKRKPRSVSKAARARSDSVSPGVAALNGVLKTRPLGDSARHATPCYHEDRHASIAEAAYFRSQHRGFVPGHELEDWLAAEEEVDQRLIGEGRAS